DPGHGRRDADPHRRCRRLGLHARGELVSVAQRRPAAAGRLAPRLRLRRLGPRRGRDPDPAGHDLAAGHRRCAPAGQRAAATRLGGGRRVTFAIAAIAVSLALPLLSFRGRTLRDYLLFLAGSWIAGAGLRFLGLEVYPYFGFVAL